MTTLTTPKEANSRVDIDIKLRNLWWILDEKDPNCNVFKEQPRTKDEKLRLNGKFPDYVLYDDQNNPIAIIEAKRPNVSLEAAFDQAITLYANKLNTPLVFVSNWAFVQARFLRNWQPLKIDWEELQDFIDQYTCLRFLKEGESDIYSSIKSTTTTREEILRRFKWANDLLREEWLRQGFERFTALADILFLKLFDEWERAREFRWEQRLLDKKYCWSSFIEQQDSLLLDYIKDSVWKQLWRIYPKLFKQDFLIKKPEVLREMIKMLDFDLSSIDTDIKWEAFEFFLRNVTNGNKDLWEYYTPRHIAKTTVRLLNPKFWETIYDPFCWTWGFLTEAFKFLKLTIDDTNEVNMKILKENTLNGREISSTSRIAQMNLVLFDDGFSNIEQMDSLKNPIKNKYDIVITNIPYSQQTKYGSYYDIPVWDKDNADIICVQHCWDALKQWWRWAIVVPETFLYKSWKTEVLRKRMIDGCSEFTVVSLPRWVFNPYTPTKTDILVFKKKKEGEASARKNGFFFVIQNDGFELGWRRRPLKWKSDLSNIFSDERELQPPYANIVSFEDIKSHQYNLRPFFYMEDVIKSDRQLLPLAEIIEEKNEIIDPTEFPTREFKLCSVSQDGVFLSDLIMGDEFTQKYKVVHAGDLVYNPHRINIWSIGIVPDHLDWGLVSKIYPVFSSVTDIPNFYILNLLKQKRYNTIIMNYSLDSARANLPLEELKRIKIPQLTESEILEVNSLFKKIIKNEKELHDAKQKTKWIIPEIV